jgi:hypothetical protein
LTVNDVSEEHVAYIIMVEEYAKLCLLPVSGYFISWHILQL